MPFGIGRLHVSEQLGHRMCDSCSYARRSASSPPQPERRERHRDDPKPFFEFARASISRPALRQEDHHLCRQALRGISICITCSIRRRFSPGTIRIRRRAVNAQHDADPRRPPDEVRRAARVLTSSWEAGLGLEPRARLRSRVRGGPFRHPVGASSSPA